MKEIKTLGLKDGTQIVCDVFDLQKEKWLVCVHGVAEHSGRNTYLPDTFTSHYNVFQFDLRGHGRSSGRRAYIADFEQYARDLAEIIDILGEKFGMKEFCIFGHSMGGLIVADYLQNHAKKDLYPFKAYLSSPAIAVPGFPGKYLFASPYWLTRFLSKIPFSIPLQGFVDLRMLSHDEKIYEDYISDSLNILMVHTRLGFGLTQRAREVFSRSLNLRCPLFASIGTEDKLVCSEAFINYFEKIETSATTLVVEGGYHELSNEIEKYRKPYMDFLKQSLMP